MGERYLVGIQDRLEAHSSGLLREAPAKSLEASEVVELIETITLLRDLAELGVRAAYNGTRSLDNTRLSRLTRALCDELDTLAHGAKSPGLQPAVQGVTAQTSSHHPKRAELLDNAVAAAEILHRTGMFGKGAAQAEVARVISSKPASLAGFSQRTIRARHDTLEAAGGLEAAVSALLQQMVMQGRERTMIADLKPPSSTLALVTWLTDHLTGLACEVARIKEDRARMKAKKT